MIRSVLLLFAILEGFVFSPEAMGQTLYINCTDRLDSYELVHEPGSKDNPEHSGRQVWLHKGLNRQADPELFDLTDLLAQINFDEETVVPGLGGLHTGDIRQTLDFELTPHFEDPPFHVLKLNPITLEAIFWWEYRGGSNFLVSVSDFDPVSRTIFFSLHRTETQLPAGSLFPRSVLATGRCPARIEYESPE